MCAASGATIEDVRKLNAHLDAGGVVTLYPNGGIGNSWKATVRRGEGRFAMRDDGRCLLLIRTDGAERPLVKMFLVMSD